MPKYSSADKALLNGWVSLLETIEWTSFCTFTTYYRLSQKNARIKMETMTEHLRRKHGKEVQIFWVAEPFASKNNFHIHALIKTPGKVCNTKQAITEAWHTISPPAGFGKPNLLTVEKFEPSRGARAYVAKHIQKDNVDYDLL